MKATSLLVTASVAGALVIGGAATGATLAAWHDQAAVNAGTLASGDIALTADSYRSAEMPALTGLAPNAPKAVRLSLRNSGPTAAKNLRLRGSVTAVDSSNAEVPVQLSFRKLGSAGEACTAADTFPLGVGDVLTDALAPEETGHVCVKVALLREVLPAEAATSQITLTLTGTQVTLP
jgi:predicted ribosomally synthesized peptide with SipW-like signal peptide